MNPQKWEDAVQLANAVGLRAICVFNDHRERLIFSRGIAVNEDNGNQELVNKAKDRC